MDCTGVPESGLRISLPPLGHLLLLNHLNSLLLPLNLLLPNLLLSFPNLSLLLLFPDLLLLLLDLLSLVASQLPSSHKLSTSDPNFDSGGSYSYIMDETPDGLAHVQQSPTENPPTLAEGSITPEIPQDLNRGLRTPAGKLVRISRSRIYIHVQAPLRPDRRLATRKSGVI